MVQELREAILWSEDTVEIMAMPEEVFDLLTILEETMPELKWREGQTPTGWNPCDYDDDEYQEHFFRIEEEGDGDFVMFHGISQSAHRTYQELEPASYWISLWNDNPDAWYNDDDNVANMSDAVLFLCEGGV